MNSVTIYIEPAGRNIYDLAEHYTLEIRLGRRFKFAVVAPAYYRIPPTRHVGKAGAIRRARELRDYDGVKVINIDGLTGSVDRAGWHNEFAILFDDERDPCISVERN